MRLGLKSSVVELTEHDPAWGEVAASTIQTLKFIFASAARDIQHIGSTSIRGIVAKPIIDIAVAVNDFSEFKPLIPELERNGFSYRGWFLVNRITVLNVYDKQLSGDILTTHHVHVVRIDSADWHNHINFRDYMNAHPSAAKEYEAIKIALASAHPTDGERRRYNEGKNGFINRVLSDAAAWRRSRDA